MKKFFRNFYLLLIFLFLYAPIAVLMLYSFNDSKSRRIWHGFTTKWYVELLGDADILHSLYVTLLVAVIAAVLATLLGTVAAITCAAARAPPTSRSTTSQCPPRIPSWA